MDDQKKTDDKPVIQDETPADSGTQNSEEQVKVEEHQPEESENQIKSETSEDDQIKDSIAPLQNDNKLEADETESIPEPEVAQEAQPLEEVSKEANPAEEEVQEEAKVEEAAPQEEAKVEETKAEEQEETKEEVAEETPAEEVVDEPVPSGPPAPPNARWYVIHTFAGHENRVATTIKQRVEAEHLENLIFDILVPTQDKIEIRAGKKETVKEKIFPGYILIKMVLDDNSWLAVRTTQGVTSFVGAANKPTPVSEAEVSSIVKFTTQGAQPTFKDVFMVDDTVKIIDGPFAEFIGKVDSVDKEKGRVRVLVSIFGRETPVELDFLQVQKL